MGSWKQAIIRLVASWDWALDLVDERRAANLVRSLLGAEDRDRVAGTRHLDRLPEWLDLLTSWLDDPRSEALALSALADEPRLAGPYAQLALRSYLERQVRRALAGDAIPDDLWAIALRIDRWVREHPRLGAVHLAPPDPALNLTSAAGALRDLVRRLEAAKGDEREVRELLAAWPESPPAAPSGGAPGNGAPGLPRPPRGHPILPGVEPQPIGGAAGDRR